MSGMVNTSFILDMQLKLYQWSASDKDRTFSDLFNLICDRRTLIEALGPVDNQRAAMIVAQRYQFGA